MDHILRVVPVWLERILALGMHREQFHFLHLFRDLARVVDHDLLRCFRPQVGKLLQHLVRRFEVQRRLFIRIAVFHSRLDDRPADGILRIQKMHVTGRNHRDAQFIAQGDNHSVQFPQFLLRGSLSFPDQERVVPDRLNLQIVVEGGNLLQPLVILPRQHRTEQFPRLARAADNQSFPVFPDQEAGHMRHPLEIFQMPGGNQPVQVHQAGPVFRQQNDMPAFPDGTALQVLIQIRQALRLRESLPHVLKHALQALGRCRGVVHRPVGVFETHAQMFAQCSEPEGFQVRIQFPGIGQRIDHRP